MVDSLVSKQRVQQQFSFAQALTSSNAVNTSEPIPHTTIQGDPLCIKITQTTYAKGV